MSDDTKCFACEPTAARLPKYAWRCTGRPGCVRAAGTEGGATDGMGTRAVDWPGESEITRLRAENARLTATVAGLNETLDAANDMMADAATDAVRRIRSGEIVGFMASDVVVMSREQHDSDHEVVTRLRAEVERLTKERDEARRTVEEQSFLIVENIQDHAERRARDVAMVKAGIEAAARVADQWSRVSPLHKYGPAGPTRGEKTAMANAKMIAEDTRALDPAAIAASLNAKEE